MPKRLALSDIITREEAESPLRTFAWLLGERLKEKRSRYEIGEPLMTMARKSNRQRELVVRMPVKAIRC